jgi:hypothetical protein
MSISPEALKEVQLSEQIYDAERRELVQRMMHKMQSKFNISWNQEFAENVSVLLSRVFIDEQLKIARKAAVEMTALGLVQQIGDPLQELRDAIRNSGVAPLDVQRALMELVDTGRGMPLIKKLSAAALFCAVEGSSPLSGVKALGAGSWSEVVVYLDASVAIPYLCSMLFEPTDGRFSQSATACVTELKKCGADIRIPYFYLEESAAHLLRALDYIDVRGFEKEMIYSRNGYIAHYYSLLALRKSLPSGILDYLRCFSPSLNRTDRQDRNARGKVISDLQPKFRQYGIDFEYVGTPSERYIRDIETEFAYWLDRMERKKQQRLLQHDVRILGQMGQTVAEDRSSVICLTWDGSMIAVGRKLGNCGWVVSPEEATDFCVALNPLGSCQLATLAHTIARIGNCEAEVAARILDRIVLLGREKLQDREFLAESATFKQELLGRIDVGSSRYDDWIDEKTDEFLKKQGVELHERAEADVADDVGE